MTTTKTPKATALNLSVLRRYVRADGVTADLSAVQPTETQHLRRCLAAGLLEKTATRAVFTLTPAGLAALGAAV